jgi:uncharacterized protein (TIGR00255 family)
MIKSMTAYAGAEYSSDALAVKTEIRSYNSRQLDIVLRLPNGYLSVEEKIKELVSDRVLRGRLEMKVQIESEAGDAEAFEIDKSKAHSYYSVLNQLRNEFKVDSEITLENLLHAGGIIKPAEISRDIETALPTIQECVNQALAELDRMRVREGDFIARDLSERLAHIEKQLENIRNGSVGLVSVYQQRLKERIVKLTQDMVEIDPGRIAQEAAILADRSDISEEIVRAESHLQQFHHIMKSDESAGRKLNFLLQELHREFNTMGSKVGNAEISHVIIDVKSELEKIREQVQNVE